MSKTQLKKELKAMDADQMRELILDLYAARPEAKAYFDFFLDPDVDKLTDRAKAAVNKELGRIKRGMLSARFSVIRKALKDYESFGPGADHVLRLMLDTLARAVAAERLYYAKPAFVNGTARLALDTLKYGDKHLLFDQAVEGVRQQLPLATFILRGPLKEALAQFGIQ